MHISAASRFSNAASITQRTTVMIKQNTMNNFFRQFTMSYRVPATERQKEKKKHRWSLSDFLKCVKIFGRIYIL